MRSLPIPRDVGEALVLRLGQLGVTRFYANPGSEFASVIHAFDRLPKELIPSPILAPHEFLAVGAAYGSYLATGKLQAVMTHANVGAANALIGLIGAYRMNIPLILISGMTSRTERSVRRGRRDKVIHWSQESSDQASIYREYVKWEVEVQDASSLIDSLDRAVAIARSDPQGPVAISLSRDVLLEQWVERLPDTPQCHPLAPSIAPPPPVDAIIRRLSSSQRPMVVTNRLGADPRSVELLERVSDRHAIGVSTPEDFYMSFPQTHAHHLGYGQGAVGEADFVLALETEVPWFPLEHGPPSGAFVAHVGVDPLFQSLGLRSHRGDLFVRSGMRDFLERVAQADPTPERVVERRAWIQDFRRRSVLSQSSTTVGTRLDPRSVSRILGEFMDERTVLINELGLVPSELPLVYPGTYFRSGSASCLGWGVGCGIGYAVEKKPDQSVWIVIGDGVFFLSSVVGALQMAHSLRAPVLILILNNGGMQSVAQTVKAAYPDSPEPTALIELAGSEISLENVASIFGGLALRATHSESLRSAMAQAKQFLKENRGSVVLNAIMS